MLGAMPTDLTRRTVHRAGVDLAVFEGGDPAAPTIVLVHGWPDTHWLWHGVMERLAREFRVVAFDLRGMGESGDPGAVAGFTLVEMADDLFAVIDAVSPDEPVHVLAHDWGSVAVWEAVCRPGSEHRIASFVSISGPSLDHMGLWMKRSLRRPTPTAVGGLLAQVLSSWYLWLYLTPLARVFFGRFGTARRWGRFLRRIEGYDPEPWHHAPTLTRDMVSGLRIYRANVLSGLGGPRERRTAVPVLQVVPTRDIAIRGAGLRESERWADQLERREIPYGHWVALGHPDVVAAEAARFFMAVAPHR